MAVVIVAIGVWISFRAAADLGDIVDTGLRSRADVLVAELRGNGAVIANIQPQLIEADESFVQLADASGAITQSSQRVQGAPMLAADTITAVVTPTIIQTHVPGIGNDSRILVVPVPEVLPQEYLLVGSSLQDRADHLLQIQLTLGFGGLLLLTLASYAGWVLAGAALRPMDRLRKEVADFSDPSAPHRLTVSEDDGDEVQRLGSTLNEMLARIEGAMTREREFLDVASKELEMPLTVLKGELDVALARARNLRSFVPQGIADQIEAGGDMRHEELEATILFSDIRGFSALAERLSPREAAERVGRHLTAMAEVVDDHGGMVDKFQGDAVMAVFGVPEPTPDHAERALRCAIAMQARQVELNGELAREGLDALEMGVGVNTGTVIAGTVGGGGRLEYTVVGDAVNVAQRLQAGAKGGEILATRATVEAAPGVRSHPRGDQMIKGRLEPVTVFSVT